MRLRILQILVLGLLIVFWYLMTAPGLIPPFYFDKPNRAAFFFGEPLVIEVKESPDRIEGW